MIDLTGTSAGGGLRTDWADIGGPEVWFLVHGFAALGPIDNRLRPAETHGWPHFAGRLGNRHCGKNRHRPGHGASVTDGGARVRAVSRKAWHFGSFRMGLMHK